VPVVTDPVTLVDAVATEVAGAKLAKALGGSGGVVFLHGPLGAGKTTLVRGLLRALGVTGAVRSPTYTLVEPYDTKGARVLHVDLYRLADSSELESLGIREMLDGDTLLLVEWPERAPNALPGADLHLTLAHAGDGRTLAWAAGSSSGQRVLDLFVKTIS
jgi:tRNA threonylcarbamoyladenosine biosynthesis protein TsaE